jgi:hypothetical protein
MKKNFSRLVSKVKQKLGPSVVGEAIIMHLKRAIEFRGRSAHRHFSPADDSESANSQVGLCNGGIVVFINASDLPINAAGIERAHSNPFIRDYRRYSGN